MNSSAVPYWITLGVLLVALYGGFQVYRSQDTHSAALDPPQQLQPLKEFSLTDSRGQEVHSQDLEGQVWVANFFFTTCPTACLQVNQRIASMQTDPELKDVKWLSISCDPETDTPEVLTQYAANLKADPERWHFCRGELDYVKRIGKGMQTSVVFRDHGKQSVVIDRTGNVRGHFDLSKGQNVPAMRNMLVSLVAEKGPAKQAISQETVEEQNQGSPTEDPQQQTGSAENEAAAK